MPRLLQIRKNGLSYFELKKHICTVVLSLCLNFIYCPVFADDIDQLISTRNCIGCDLRGSDLSGQQWSGVNLKWSNLSGTKLDGANFSGANLLGVDFSDASLKNTIFKGAIMEGAILVGTDLTTTQLAGADLRWANISHLDADIDLEFIDLIGVNLFGAIFKNEIRCGKAPDKGGWGCAAE